MARTIVGVIRGGASSEYEHSLKTGGAILAALPEDAYDVRDIFVDKRGVWHSRGTPSVPGRALAQIDVVLNALHGGAGEDGTVQRIFERLSVPYTGSRPVPSSLALNKVRTRERLASAGIRMPRAVSFSFTNELDTGEMARIVFAQFSPPYIVKPGTEGSSSGVLFVPTILELPDAIGDTLDTYGSGIIEEYILGEEAVVGVLQDFRHDPFYALPPAHVIVPSGRRFLEHGVRIGGEAKILAPSAFSHSEKRVLEDAARHAHSLLGLSHYSTVDFILTKRGPVLLEVDALPHLHDAAPFHHMLDAVGVSLRDFLGHVIDLARRGA